MQQRRKSTMTSSFGTPGRISHNAEKFYDSKLYQELNKSPLLDSQESVFPDECLNSIILGSCETMQELPDNCLHLMITSPPYNVSKEYDQDLSLQEYLQLLTNVFTETYRVLVNGGRACVNIANLGRKPYRRKLGLTCVAKLFGIKRRVPVLQLRGEVGKVLQIQPCVTCTNIF